MQINVTYDSSTANAPAGFKTAVMAAVQYWEDVIANPITVNITFGYGEVDGEALETNALSESISNSGRFTYANVASALSKASTSADDAAAVATLPSTDPTNGGTFALNTALQKALGLFQGDPNAVDGYVGLSSSAPFDYDPLTRVLTGDYDAVGALEHEISEVLGRISYAGAPLGGGGDLYGPLDLFRYASSGVRQLGGGAASFSVNGQTLLLPFNNAVKYGGDAGDWDVSTPQDSFDAFVLTGNPAYVSPTDLRVMDILGYTLKPSLYPPTIVAPNIAPTSATNVTQNLTVAAGTTIYFNSSSGYQISESNSATISFYNSGSIFSVNSGENVNSEPVVQSGTPEMDSQIQNAASGSIYAVSAGDGSLAIGIEGLNNLRNDGLIEVSSLNAYGSAEGIVSPYFNTHIYNTGTISAWSENFSVGIYLINGGYINNSRTITVTGDKAFGILSNGPLTNSGDIVAIHNVGSYLNSVGVYANAAGSLVNSGLIRADQAVYAQSNGYPGGYNITNTGVIDGQIVFEIGNSTITNRGCIYGEISLELGTNTYDGRSGVQTGGILSGLGDNTIIGGRGGVVVIYNFASANANWNENSDGSWTLHDSAGVDTLRNVTALQFTDKTVALPPLIVNDDFNQDGVSDFLIKNTLGAVVVGEVVDDQAQFTQIGGLGPEWTFEGTGNFLGGAAAGFLIENTNGAVVLGGVADGQATYAQISGLGHEWKFEGVGDFLGDGKADFLIENNLGAVVVGEIVGGQASYTQIGGLGADWSFVGTGDFLGEGRDQFLLENTSGAVVVGNVMGGQASYTQLGGLGHEWKFVGTGDFLGDGKTDFLIENTNGAVVLGEVSNGIASYTQITGLAGC
jgi:hypothetical protein